MGTIGNVELDDMAQAPSDEHEMEAVLHDLFEMVGGARFDEESGEMDTSDFQDQLTAFSGCRVRTFQDAGLMTRNQGVIVTTRDGLEFQLTVIAR